MHGPGVALNDEILIIVSEILDDVREVAQHLINHVLQLLTLLVVLLIQGVQRESAEHLHVFLLLFEDFAGSGDQYLENFLKQRVRTILIEGFGRFHRVVGDHLHVLVVAALAGVEPLVALVHLLDNLVVLGEHDLLVQLLKVINTLYQFLILLTQVLLTLDR